jgi:glycosyltransferase involved in cell wall biosynthesis
MKQPKILVAIPACNCEKQIQRVLQGSDKQLLGRIEKIIGIDDGGGGNTAEVAQRAIQQLKLPQPKVEKVEVVQNVHNLGLGGSHKMAKTLELNNLIDVAEKILILGPCSVADL